MVLSARFPTSNIVKVGRNPRNFGCGNKRRKWELCRVKSADWIFDHLTGGC